MVGHLAVLALVDIANGEAGDTIVVWHGAVDIQERERSVTALLSVRTHESHNTEASRLVKVVVKSDSLRKIGAGVQSARALVVVDGGASESVLEHPVGASFWALEACVNAVAGGVDAILVVEVDHGDNAGDVDAWEVSHAASIVVWCLEEGELILGDLSLADSVVGILVSAGE